MGRTSGLIARIVAAVLALLLVVLKAATLAGWIAANPTVEFWIIVAAGLVVFVQSLRGAARLSRLPRQEQRQRQLEKAVLASLKSVSDVTHVDLTTIGGCVYAVRRHAWPFRHRRLRRLVRYRLSEYPQGSGIKWTDRKGVVGQSLRDVAPRHFNWRQIAADWNDPRNVPRTAYDALPQAERMGFPFEEFRKVARKYSEGLAVPIVSDGSACETPVLRAWRQVIPATGTTVFRCPIHGGGRLRPGRPRTSSLRTCAGCIRTRSCRRPSIDMSGTARPNRTRSLAGPARTGRTAPPGCRTLVPGPTTALRPASPGTRMSCSGCPRPRRHFFPGFPRAGFAEPELSCIVWGESPTIL